MTKYLYLQNVIYSLVKQTFWDHVKEEARSIGDTLMEFFSMIKGLTYDKVANIFGAGATGIIFGMIIVIIITFVLMKIINR